MLSAKELFKYKNGLEQSMPPKGGVKDFMPDGSWLQDKHIENFHQERERAISEPRVLRSKDLVKGEWKPEVGLVELFHEMKNFWENMGFNDQKRKWLHPEEALFLLETSIMEIWYGGLPMSLQEVYSAFTGRFIQLEFYQVYACLRRVGYVVLRHQGRYIYTKYERQIGLHKFHEKKKNKGSKSDESTAMVVNDLSSDRNIDMTDETSCDVDGIDAIKVVRDETPSNVDDIDSLRDETPCDVDGIDSVPDNEESEEQRLNATKCTKDISESCHVQVPPYEDTTFNMNVDTDKNITGDIDEPNQTNSEPINKPISEPINELSELINADCDSRTKYSSWNFDEIVFPNFFSGGQVVNVDRPNTAYIPQGSDLEFSNQSYEYEKSKFINTKKERKKKMQLRDKEAEDLEFSHPEVMTGWQKVKKTCGNWAEYKEAKKKEKQARSRCEDFPHLYKDKIEPLVKPESAKSTYSLLSQLQVIGDYKPDTQGRGNDVPDVLPDFDVYAPNTKFKKTRPGIPDFRVKVVRSDEPVPDLKTLTVLDNYLKDEVLLHWSVVDCGNIAFYNMSDFSLPVDISLG